MRRSPIRPVAPVPGHPRRLLSSGDLPASRLLDSSDVPRIFSRADCEALFKRVVACTSGGGDTQVTLRSTWTTNLRWGRNRPISSDDIIEQTANITRFINGMRITAEVTQFDDVTLQAMVHQLEQDLSSDVGADHSSPEPLGQHLIMSDSPYQRDPFPEPLGRQEYLTPTIWSDATFNMSLRALSDAARKSVDPVVDAKLMAAGYAEIGATSWAIFNTRGLNAYAAATGALYTETVRHPDGSASGWAGKSHTDWAKLDSTTLSQRALQKCRDSVNSVKVEPGRYTAILEPKATGIMMWEAVKAMDRKQAEKHLTVYTLEEGVSKIGYQVFDPRITLTSDPTDPDCSYIPFDPEGNPYRKVTWVENGILKELPYNRTYARKKLGTDTVLSNPLAFRMSGGDTPIEEMIATTERGIYVTHFDEVAVVDSGTLNLTSVTCDGLWLIEHGKIAHPIKNLWINESPMVIFNQVLQLGMPERTVGVQDFGWGGVLKDLPTQALSNGNTPLVAPAVKVRDFNFVRLSDAI